MSNGILTESIKKTFDEMSYEQMLSRWRFGKIGDPWFQGETGRYFSKVMAEKREHVNHSEISKKVGW